MRNAVEGSSGRVWAITSYFTFDDPAGLKRRLAVYREFRRHLQVPVAAIELSLDGRFDLNDEDADILVRVSGGDLMWQKERLLNCVLEALPSECDTVAWLDCDVVLTRPDWASATREALRKSVVLQPFRNFYFATVDTWPGPGSTPPFSVCRESACSMYVRGALPVEVHATRGGSLRAGYSPGVAWAASREFLERHRLYDAAIVGSGDKLLLSSSCGRYADAATALEMTGRHREHYCAWAEPFAAAVAGRIGFVEGDVYHLWHGDMPSRQYASRYAGFHAFEFDPLRDLAKTPSGAWRWNSDKPEMHAFVRKFFDRRKNGAAPSEPHS